MANRGCSNLEVDVSMYSSPVPLIGLYIAAGSLLCFLAMLFDISSAIYRRKRWLPCRLFTLNSVTLTLFAIAAKLPVDLTASMPSNLDQFSKLSGMAFICISMGFLMPSLGMNQKSEGISNMIALSIMVVTLIVNICIQIHTRVIILFVTEHIIIMVCMLGLLLALWMYFVAVSIEKNNSLDNNKDILRKGRGCMLERLKLAYLYGFDNNPQFFLCRNSELGMIPVTCMVCSIALIQAAFRNLSVNFCNGKSDYGWSMWVIVAVQSVAIVVGCLAIVFRWVALSVRLKLQAGMQSMTPREKSDIILNSGFRLSSKDRCKCVLVVLPLFFVGFLFYIPVYVPSMLVRKAAIFIVDLFLEGKYKDDEDIKQYKHLIVKDGEGLEEWVVAKSSKEMKRWIEVSRRYSPNHLLKLLSEAVPSQEADPVNLRGLSVSTMSLALLARIAQVSLPAEDAGQSLVQAYSEVCEILHFIEDRTKSKTSQYVYAREIAKAVRRGNGFGYLVLRVSGTDPLRRALSILKILKKSIWSEMRELLPSLANNLNLSDPEYWKEMVLLVNCLLNIRWYDSIEDLSKQMQLVFIDMFHTILAQLPHALYNEVVDSTAENFDQSVRRSLGVLCQVELLQPSIRWSYPGETDIFQLWPEHGEELP